MNTGADRVPIGPALPLRSILGRAFRRVGLRLLAERGPAPERMGANASGLSLVFF